MRLSEKRARAERFVRSALERERHVEEDERLDVGALHRFHRQLHPVSPRFDSKHGLGSGAVKTQNQPASSQSG